MLRFLFGFNLKNIVAAGDFAVIIEGFLNLDKKNFPVFLTVFHNCAYATFKPPVKAFCVDEGCSLVHMYVLDISCREDPINRKFNNETTIKQHILM